jgi:hypothetical protein
MIRALHCHLVDYGKRGESRLDQPLARGVSRKD